MIELISKKLTHCKEIRQIAIRRNGSYLFEVSVNDEKKILKVAQTNIILEEESQKQQLANNYYNTPATIEEGNLNNIFSYIIEEYIGPKMLIDNILKSLESGYINSQITNNVHNYFSNISYKFSTYSKEKDPFYDIVELNKLGDQGLYILQIYEKLKNELIVDEKLVLSHGDFTPFNISQELVLIDFEDVGNYPIGFDIISFFFSHLWFPKESEGIPGLHRLYEITIEQQEKVHTLIAKLINEEDLSIVRRYTNLLILLRGIWHILGSKDHPSFQYWRAKKIIEMANNLFNSEDKLQ